MNEHDILSKMRADNFISNNGVVLRAINIGRTKYNRLSQLRRALETEIDSADFIDSVNYLSEAGYIKLRRCSDKTPASISDDDFENIEAKLSDKGIKLLAGKISDDCIRA